MADFDSVKKEVDDIIEKYYHEEEGYYSRYRYDEDDNEFNMPDELKEYFTKNHIDYELSEEEGYHSTGYDCDFIAVAFKVNNSSNFGSRLRLATVKFESF